MRFLLLLPQQTTIMPHDGKEDSVRDIGGDATHFTHLWPLPSWEFKAPLSIGRSI